MAEHEIDKSGPDHLRRLLGGPTSFARQGDPRRLAEILEVLLHAGPVTSAELEFILRERSGTVRTRIVAQGSLADWVGAGRARPEFLHLGWIAPDKSRWILTEEGAAVARTHPSASPSEFAKRLCVAGDRRLDRLISRLLTRLWQLNPHQQGAVILPQPSIRDVPDDVHGFNGWVISACEKWHGDLRKNSPGVLDVVEQRTALSGRPESAEKYLIRRSLNLVTLISSMWGETWQGMELGRRRTRLQRVITGELLDILFGDILAPGDFQVWQSRMDWAGLTLLARNLFRNRKRVWFPVGAFRDDAPDDFTAVPGLGTEGRTWFCYTPKGPDAERKLADALFEAYQERQRVEPSQYVSLPAVRDYVCYKLRIGNAYFESLLQQVFPRVLNGELPYAMALEVDVSAAERARLGNSLPIVIDGIPRFIMAMQRKQP